MKTDNFLTIKFNKHKYYSSAKNQRELIAFDTETEKGKCGIIANSNEEYFIGDEYLEILEFLTDEKYFKTVNVFFNLGYDTNAIIKTLPEKNIIELAERNRTIIADYEISMIPNKILNIKIHNKIYRYFDLWQFFKYESLSSLDAVSQKYLHEPLRKLHQTKIEPLRKLHQTKIEPLGKLHQTNQTNQKIDIEALTGIKKQDYTLRNFKEIPEILNYCIHDCILTKKLGDIIINKCNILGINFNRPYSCATISIDYFFGLKGLKSPYWFYFNSSTNNRRVFEYAFNSYKGGRFEVFKKGTFENIYDYDVNSMYPSQMTKLQDCMNFSFHYFKNEKGFDLERNKETFYAFLKIEVNQKHEHINFLPLNEKGLLIYPKKEFITTITYPELQILEKYNIQYKIIDGYIGEHNNTNINYPFRDIIIDIFKERKKYEKQDFISSLYKIIMNSLYGKFIEININHTDKATKDLTQQTIDEHEQDIKTKEFLAGKYFNSIYASYITALSRCCLYDTIMKNDYNDIIACFTDSIISQNELKNINTGKELGQWDSKKYDYINIIGTGLYYMSNNDDIKIRTRGFHLQGMKDFNFNDFLNCKYLVKKNKKLKEAVIQKDINNFNVIIEQIKNVDLNFDKKRIWNDKFNCVDDVFTKQIESKSI